MTPEIFCEQFATFAEAPNGVGKLRELILQLAVRGKLVPQDENDETADALLARIVRQSTELGERESASRKSVRSTVNSNGRPSQLPRGWIQTRLGVIAEIIMGNSPPGSSYNDHGKGVPLINGPVEFSVGPFGLTMRTKFTTEPTKFCKKNDLLICVRGSTTGRTNIAAFDACIGRGVAAVQAGEVQSYVNLFVLALRQAIFDMGTGSTFPSISFNQIADIPFPLPPLAEQRRIVGKVDQLLGLCDELAARQAARREARSALVGATLDRLVSPRRQPNSSSPSPQSSGERGAGGEGLNRSKRRPPHPQPFSPEYGGEGSKDMDINRLRDHFDRLFDTPTTLPQLRQAILQLAVQGQLVPQDPNDEPARVADDATNVCGLFDIPSQWQWVTVEQIGYSRLGKMLDKVKNKGTPFAYLRNTNVHWFRFDLSSIKEMPFAHDELDAFEVHPGDVLICEGGHGIGRTAVWNGELKRVMFQKALHRVRPSRNLDGTFFAYCMRVYDSTGVLQTYYTGAGIPHLTGRSLAKVAFPLPPLAEQKRIVSRVTELLSLCDALETKLTQAESASSQLLSASVHHLLKRL